MRGHAAHLAREHGLDRHVAPVRAGAFGVTQRHLGDLLVSRACPAQPTRAQPALEPLRPAVARVAAPSARYSRLLHRLADVVLRQVELFGDAPRGPGQHLLEALEQGGVAHHGQRHLVLARGRRRAPRPRPSTGSPWPCPTSPPATPPTSAAPMSAGGNSRPARAPMPTPGPGAVGGVLLAIHDADRAVGLASHHGGVVGADQARVVQLVQVGVVALGGLQPVVDAHAQMDGPLRHAHAPPSSRRRGASP